LLGPADPDLDLVPLNLDNEGKHEKHRKSPFLQTHEPMKIAFPVYASGMPSHEPWGRNAPQVLLNRPLRERQRARAVAMLDCQCVDSKRTACVKSTGACA